MTKEWVERNCAADLPPGEIHVWRVDLNPPIQVFEKLNSLLSADERERKARFRQPDLGRRFATAHGALRWLLGGYAHEDPANLVFQYSSNGKPELETAGMGQRLNFSLAHTEDLGLVACGWELHLGIDVESLSRPINYAHIANRFFTVEESTLLNRLPGEKRRGAFLRAWVQKEAYLKALGSGLTRSLNRLQVEVSPDTAMRLVVDRDDLAAGNEWQLQELLPAPGYVAALAYRAMPLPVECFSLKI